jgi:hypothetical protein
VPRFYFHIVAGSVVLDDVGTVLGDAKAALQHAKTLASDLRDNHALTSGTIVVEDEDAGQLFEVPLAGLFS